VIGFHFEKALHSVSLWVIVDNRVVICAQQDEIVKAVPLGGRLLGVIAWPVRTCCLDVADLPHDYLALHKPDRAIGKSTSISRMREQPLDGGLARACRITLFRHRKP
jgi:hypothetical protein